VHSQLLKDIFEYINEKKYQNAYEYRLFMIKRNNYYAKYSIIIGQSELENGTLVVKDMKSFEQETIKLENIVDYLQEKVRGEK